MITIPTLDAAKLAIAPYMLAIKVAAAALMLIAAAVLYWRIGVWHEGFLEREQAIAGRAAAEKALQAELDCLDGTDCANRAVLAAAEGLEAVEKARQAAQEAASAEQARVAAAGQAAVQRAEKAASVAAVRLRDAEARLRRSIAEDATCAAQAAEVIRCEY
jgi:hypothetical protein